MVGGASQASGTEPEAIVRLYPEPGRMVVQVDREPLKNGPEPVFLVVQLQQLNGKVVRNKRLALDLPAGKTLSVVLDAVFPGGGRLSSTSPSSGRQRGAYRKDHGDGRFLAGSGRGVQGHQNPEQPGLGAFSTQN